MRTEAATPTATENVTPSFLAIFADLLGRKTEIEELFLDKAKNTFTTC